MHHWKCMGVQDHSVGCCCFFYRQLLALRLIVICCIHICSVCRMFCRCTASEWVWMGLKAVKTAAQADLGGSLASSSVSFFNLNRRSLENYGAVSSECLHFTYIFLQDSEVRPYIYSGAPPQTRCLCIIIVAFTGYCMCSQYIFLLTKSFD